jgi:hypothetical protein
VNSTDTTTVGTTVTSPTADLCAATVRPAVRPAVLAMATAGVPSTVTGLPFAGMAVRLRGSKTGWDTFAATGLPIGADALPTVQIGAERLPATNGGYAERTSSTPGDLPPGALLS